MAYPNGSTMGMTWDNLYVSYYCIISVCLTRNVSSMKTRVLRLLLTDVHSAPKIVPRISRNSLNIWINEWLNQSQSALLHLLPVFASCGFLFSLLGRVHSVTCNERTYSYFSRSCHFIMGNWNFQAHSFSLTPADFKSTFLYFSHSLYFWSCF